MLSGTFLSKTDATYLVVVPTSLDHCVKAVSIHSFYGPYRYSDDHELKVVQEYHKKANTAKIHLKSCRTKVAGMSASSLKLVVV